MDSRRGEDEKTYRAADDGPGEAREADDALRDAVCEADHVRRGHCEMGRRREGITRTGGRWRKEELVKCAIVAKEGKRDAL